MIALPMCACAAGGQEKRCSVFRRSKGSRSCRLTRRLCEGLRRDAAASRSSCRDRRQSKGPRTMRRRARNRFQIQPRFLERFADECGMFDRQKDSGENCDACVKKETRRQSIAKQKERAERGDNRLDVQNHIHDGGIPILESHRKKNGADGRACECGEDQVTPRARTNLLQLRELRNQKRQQHEQNENVFPKHDDLGIEQFVERNAPRTFGSPQGRAQADKPRTIAGAAWLSLFTRPSYPSSRARSMNVNQPKGRRAFFVSAECIVKRSRPRNA